MTISGRLASDFMKLMGALPHRAMKQGVLPSQLKLGKHIVQAIVRIGSAQDASSAQLQQLLWGLLASHSGQPVAMDAVLSHEISKVIDAMRKNQYRDSFSLNDMANLSRMPVETFRKRFVSEVGMPPQSYQLFCKMERAKTLLKEGMTVRQAGVEVGMEDPYHFSKTFKNIVGMSPSHYTKTTIQ
ncbi:MAG TPA: AraC family transcriptional regulator [Clostridia bacterium]|nr:AraC family transcriptional regulator [Clostridia bacterium]